MYIIWVNNFKYEFSKKLFIISSFIYWNLYFPKQNNKSGKFYFVIFSFITTLAKHKHKVTCSVPSDYENIFIIPTCLLPKHENPFTNSKLCHFLIIVLKEKVKCLENVFFSYCSVYFIYLFLLVLHK